MGGLAKIYAVMGGGVVAYLALVRGVWAVVPWAVGVWMLAYVASRLLNNVVRKSRPGSRFALFAIWVTWLLLVAVTVVGGAAVLPHLVGAL